MDENAGERVTDWDQLLTTAQAAERLNYSPRTLEHWRRDPRHGLRYVRVNGGQVRYQMSALRAFVAAGASAQDAGASGGLTCLRSRVEAPVPLQDAHIMLTRLRMLRA